jgi:hypothetical protein
VLRRFCCRLTACATLIALGGAGVLVPAASSQPRGRAASDSDVQFTISEPANAQVRVQFASGITDIVEQSAVGNNLLAFLAATSAANPAFAVESSAPPGGGLATASVIVVGQLSSGTPITGTASLPAGSTMSASINDGPRQTINNGAFSIMTPQTLGAAPGPKLNVSPSRIRAGGRVKVSGNVSGGCVRGDAVTLLSKAFTKTYSFAGVPAIYANVGRNGAFSVKTTIPASRKAGNYTITGRCGGGNLGVTAHLRVLKK